MDLSFDDLRVRLQTGSLKALEVLRAYQAKAVEVNRATNCITEFLMDAEETARLLDHFPEDKRGPLHGIPISLKVY